MTKLGKETATSRGFPVISFADRYGVKCSLQASSLAEYEQPGTSAVWLGPDEPNPKIMASQARDLGITTSQTCGWIDYPLPSEVQMTTRAHLGREQVAALIEALQCWLETGHFEEACNEDREA